MISSSWLFTYKPFLMSHCLTLISLSGFFAVHSNAFSMRMWSSSTLQAMSAGVEETCHSSLSWLVFGRFSKSVTSTYSNKSWKRELVSFSSGFSTLYCRYFELSSFSE